MKLYIGLLATMATLITSTTAISCYCGYGDLGYETNFCCYFINAPFSGNGCDYNAVQGQIGKFETCCQAISHTPSTCG